MSKDTQITLDHPVNGPVTAEWVTIDTAIAQTMIGTNHGNRNQRYGKIAAYGRDMASGQWLTTGESIKYDWNGRLIDGQHRLAAIIEIGTPVRTLVVRGLDPKVQQVLDTNARRSAADALGFSGVKIAAKDIASCARVALAYESGKLRTALDNIKLEVTNAEVVAWHVANLDVSNAVALAQRVARPMGATVAGLSYAVLVLERLDPADAVEFFTSAAEFRTEGTGDPRKAMIDAFQKIRADRRAPLPAESIAIVFRAWNAWRSKKKLKLIRSGASDGSGGVTGVSIVEPK